jgi:hypothetical protein
MAECRQYERLIVSTSQIDLAYTGIGSSPMAGDINGAGIVIPDTRTPNRSRRYLMRLCGVNVNEGARVIVRSIRQLLTIGAVTESNQPGVGYPYELAVTSPVWRFVDGNVSWHLRKVNPKVPEAGPRQFNDVAPLVTPYSASQYGISSTILTRDGAGGAYVPLNGADAYGDPVAGLGTFYDMRYPWPNSTEPADLGIEVSGACDLVIFASVYQTDPTTRIVPAVAPNLLTIGPEDRFLAAFPNARYHRIGAEMVVDICNPVPK